MLAVGKRQSSQGGLVVLEGGGFPFSRVKVAENKIDFDDQRQVM